MASLKRQHFSGTAVPIRGSDIDTDQIVPARFLKEITFEKMGEYAFYDARFNEDGSEKAHPLNAPQFKQAKIMIVEDNFGCGSSREHAPQAIMRYGIEAIIGVSYSEIFSGNCKAIGVPTVAASPKDIATLLRLAEENPSAPMSIDLEKLDAVILDHTFKLELAKEKQNAFLEGSWDPLGMLKANQELILEKGKSLPY